MRRYLRSFRGSLSRTCVVTLPSTQRSSPRLQFAASRQRTRRQRTRRQWTRRQRARRQRTSGRRTSPQTTSRQTTSRQTTSRPWTRRSRRAQVDRLAPVVASTARGLGRATIPCRRRDQPLVRTCRWRLLSSQTAAPRRLSRRLAARRRRVERALARRPASPASGRPRWRLALLAATPPAIRTSLSERAPCSRFAAPSSE
jgi:hypothetical protein